jgi:crotonobetainyl-CoA:carnitine CoA-transferase CaiB-like acyl-CoA transferase
MQGAFPRLSATPSGVRSPAPSLVGQHNAEVYGAMPGFDAQRLEALAVAGVI